MPIFKKSLNDCPPRIQRMRLKLQKYDIEVKHLPGKEMKTADTLSRGPVGHKVDPYPGQTYEICSVIQAMALHPVDESDSSLEDEISAHTDGLLQVLPVTDRKKKLIQEETQRDPEMRALVTTILEGWPDEIKDCSVLVEKYWNYRDEITVWDGMVVKGTRIIIPSAMRDDLLEKIHVGHLGREKCKRRARGAVFWPCINKDIDEMVSKCSICLDYMASQPAEPLKPHPTPTEAWEKVGVDLCKIGSSEYLVVVDYYSRYPGVYKLTSQTSTEVIKYLKNCFARHGIPYELFSDNGPCFASQEFAKFASDWDFQHKTSSPHFPQSNGMAECYVKQVKNIFIKSKDPYLGLLNYRGTPLEGGLSPAELAFGGRKIRTNLPTVHVQSQDRKHVMSQVKRKQCQKLRHDKKGVKPLAALRPGQSVRVQDKSGNRKWQDKAQVLKEVAPRSYLVRSENGGVLGCSIFGTFFLIRLFIKPKLL